MHLLSQKYSGKGRIALIALTQGGRALAQRLALLVPNSSVLAVQGGIRSTLNAAWQEYHGLICIMATGIVVRAIAPLLKDKGSDPAVVVCDEQGQFAVSLLSGHLGGANALARQVAQALGGQAVITTASDVLGHTALDLWAAELALSRPPSLTRLMAKLVNQGSVHLFSEYALPSLPQDIQWTNDPAAADLIISCRTHWPPNKALLHPKSLVLGVGCKRNTSAEEISSAIEQTCVEAGFALQSVRNLATIDLKQDEAGLLQVAEQYGWPLVFYSAAQLNQVEGLLLSALVLHATGAQGVAEPAALLSSGGGPLVVKKKKWPKVTVALAALQNFSWTKEQHDAAPSTQDTL
jgi:cobalt-precorrin 5A hydrolase